MYKDVTIEIVDGPSNTGLLPPQPVETVVKDVPDQEETPEETKEYVKPGMQDGDKKIKGKESQSDDEEVKKP